MHLEIIVEQHRYEGRGVQHLNPIVAVPLVNAEAQGRGNQHMQIRGGKSDISRLNIAESDIFGSK